MSTATTERNAERVEECYTALRTLLMYQMETDPLPRKILEALREYDGKPLTVRHINKFKEAIDESIYLRKCHGTTHIGWGKYRQTDAKEGGELLIAHTEKGVVIDVEAIEHDHNARYFRAADDRNLNRTQILADETLKLWNLAKAMIEFDAAYTNAKEALDGLGSCDRFEITRQFSKLNMEAIA